MAYALLPVLFVLGFVFGRRNAKREYRREIEAGEEYLSALEEASRGCRAGTRLQLDLVVRRDPTPPARGQARLPLHVVGEG